MMEWINYKEHQPDARGVYLIRLSDGQMKVMAYETEFARIMPMVKYSEESAGWYTEEPESDRIFEVTNVTHWMPLPEPPRPEPPQIDKEKVIKGLECSANNNAACSSDCPYYENAVSARCFQAMTRDAIALLREQESVKPIVGEYGTRLCGNCGEEVGVISDSTPYKIRKNYCPECGRKVKWDD